MTDGGPAFPGKRMETFTHGDAWDPTEAGVQYPGMSLRDYFAAHALAVGVWTDPAKIAAYTYQIADAMLAERAKVTSP